MHLVEQTTVRYAVNGISASHNNNSKPYGKELQATFAVPLYMMCRSQHLP